MRTKIANRSMDTSIISIIRKIITKRRGWKLVLCQSLMIKGRAKERLRGQVRILHKFKKIARGQHLDE